MDKKRLKDEIASLVRKRDIAAGPGFCVVALDRTITGMGAGSALVRKEGERRWKARILQGRNRDGDLPEEVEVIVGEEPDDEELLEEPQPREAADYCVSLRSPDANVEIFFHVNRTNDGITVKEDDASMELEDGAQEIPIVYWNVGGAPVKVDGHAIGMGMHHVAYPADPARVERKRTYDKAMQYWKERYEAKTREIQRHIMRMEPKCSEGLAYRLALMFRAQHLEM